MHLEVSSYQHIQCSEVSLTVLESRPLEFKFKLLYLLEVFVSLMTIVGEFSNVLSNLIGKLGPELLLRPDIGPLLSHYFLVIQSGFFWELAIYAQLAVPFAGQSEIQVLRMENILEAVEQ